MTLQELTSRLTLQYSLTTKHVFIFYLCCKHRLCN